MMRAAEAVSAPDLADRGSSAERLAAGMRAMGLDASTAQRDQLLLFLALLAKWNGVYNLTSIRNPDDMLTVHLLDALSVVGLVDRWMATSLLDVGSGAGIPAIPLAIMRPALDVHSVDAVAKKIAFQLQVKAELGLNNLHPVHARIEALALPSPSIVISRAFADVPTMLLSVDHLVGDATTIIAMKGRVPTAELASLPARWKVEHIEVLDVPYLGADRCAVILKHAR